MKGIPLKKAIESGAWHECRGKYYDEDIRFRVRVLGFSPTTVEEIDPELSDEVLIEGILWLMSIEVVNMCKEPISATRVPSLLAVVDDDGFRFDTFDSDLSLDKRSGLHRFSGCGSDSTLSPKIKACGSIPFVLPDEENNYQLVVNDGQIREA